MSSSTPTPAPVPAPATGAHLKLLLDSTQDFAIITLDTEGRVTSWNVGARCLFGYAEADILGRPIGLIFTPRDRAAGVPERERQVARDEGRASDERWHVRQDGSSFFCSGIMTPLLEGGRLVGYAKIARDLTESKRAEIQLGALLEKETETRAELQRASAMKDEFLAVMSHELKHPLNLIHVSAELLARLPEARELPAVLHAADVIRKAVLSQAKITDDLLDLSRLRTGKLTINAAPVLWPAVVHRVADAVSAEALAKGLTIVVDAGEPSLIVYADAVRVEQIVWNLVSNALKFTPAGGRVELRLALDGDECRFDVIDSGQGIAQDFLGAVFEMFRQADRSTTRQHGGLGIGLALVKHLVEEQGGRVAVASGGVGQGATFSVWLPLAGGASGELIAGLPHSPLAGLRILVVDDADDALESFAALLQLEGATVAAFNNGAVAVVVERLDHHAHQRMVARRQPQQVDVAAQVLAQIAVRHHQVGRAEGRRAGAVAPGAGGLQPGVGRIVPRGRGGLDGAVAVGLRRGRTGQRRLRAVERRGGGAAGLVDLEERIFRRQLVQFLLVVQRRHLQQTNRELQAGRQGVALTRGQLQQR